MRSTNSSCAVLLPVAVTRTHQWQMKGLECAVLVVIQLEVFVVLIQVLLRSGTISTSITSTHTTTDTTASDSSHGSESVLTWIIPVVTAVRTSMSCTGSAGEDDIVIMMVMVVL